MSIMTHTDSPANPLANLRLGIIGLGLMGGSLALALRGRVAGIAAIERQPDTRQLALREGVVSVAMDDFGTGYSSLAYLARLPINALKIDRAFIMEMEQHVEGVTLVAAIISLAHSLKLEVIAEGVETEVQAAILQGLQCDLMQGYLFSKPLPFDALAAMLPQAALATRRDVARA